MVADGSTVPELWDQLAEAAMTSGCRELLHLDGLGEASAGPPEAEPGEQDGDGDEDAGFGPLEGPEVVGRVIGEVLAQAEAADPVRAGLGGGVGPSIAGWRAR